MPADRNPFGKALNVQLKARNPELGDVIEIETVVGDWEIVELVGASGPIGEPPTTFTLRFDDGTIRADVILSNHRWRRPPL